MAVQSDSVYTQKNTTITITTHLLKNVYNLLVVTENILLQITLQYGDVCTV